MAFGFVSKLQKLWPFSAFKSDDLRSSNELVRNLPIPERTKQFVYAVQDPETRSIIYILSAQSLSESSSLDVKCLVREIKPEAVIAQLGVSHGIEILAEEGELEESGKNPLPTSSVEVLRRSFVDKVSKERYEDLAGSLVLREIFGVGFHGHLLEAKKAAKETGSSFLVIESPCLNSIAGGGDGDDDVASGESAVMNKFQGLVSSLIPQQAFGSAVSLSSRRFLLTNDVHLQMVKLLSPHVETAMALPRLALSSPIAHEGSSAEIRPEESYEAPLFARSIYPLLEDLHVMFGDIPSIGRALAHAQKMLFDVNRGESVDGKIVSGVYSFRVAVEGLRIALNNAGRLPIDKLGNSKTGKSEFSELSVQEKSQLLFAQALRAQTKNFKTTVAVVDASSLAGLRKFWNDPVPVEVEHLVRELCSGDEDCDDETANQTNRKRLLTGKPVVAVGAGATAVLGVSSLSKTVQASTFMKLVTLKLPVSSLKLALAQTQKALSLVVGKTMAPTVKASTALKTTASAEKIRAVAHGVIASAEKTSLSAMRTAFYEIMRKRRVRPIGALPWATFGCSVATCSGLLLYGDGIECVVESVPTAPMVASLGRGVQRLKEVSREVRHTDSARVQNSIESLMARLKKAKIQ